VRLLKALLQLIQHGQRMIRVDQRESAAETAMTAGEQQVLQQWGLFEGFAARQIETGAFGGVLCHRVQAVVDEQFLSEPKDCTSAKKREGQGE
jgi:hypothetical protein